MTPEPPFTRRQKDFLRLLLSSPTPLAPDQWPSPVILRRWLRNRYFKNALNEVRAAYRFQTDFHLDAAGARAAARLESRLDAALADAGNDDPRDLLNTIRLAHLRQRFEPEPITQKPFPLLPWFATFEEQDRAIRNYLTLNRNARPEPKDQPPKLSLQERIANGEVKLPQSIKPPPTLCPNPGV